MDGGAKESSRAGDRARRSGQQRVHRRIGGAVALLDDPRGAAALARDRRISIASGLLSICGVIDARFRCGDVP